MLVIVRPPSPVRIDDDPIDFTGTYLQCILQVPVWTRGQTRTLLKVMERVAHPSTINSSTRNALLQIGHVQVGVCSLIVNQISASKQLMCVHASERIGVLRRPIVSYGEFHSASV